MTLTIWTTTTKAFDGLLSSPHAVTVEVGTAKPVHAEPIGNYQLDAPGSEGHFEVVG